jgi:hypothetical protein
VAAGGFVEGRRDHFTLDHALHLGHLFRALVDSGRSSISSTIR